MVVKLPKRKKTEKLTNKNCRINIHVLGARLFERGAPAKHGLSFTVPHSFHCWKYFYFKKEFCSPLDLFNCEIQFVANKFCGSVLCNLCFDEWLQSSCSEIMMFERVNNPFITSTVGIVYSTCLGGETKIGQLAGKVDRHWLKLYINICVEISRTYSFSGNRENIYARW